MYLIRHDSDFIIENEIIRNSQPSITVEEPSSPRRPQSMANNSNWSSPSPRSPFTNLGLKSDWKATAVKQVNDALLNKSDITHAIQCCTNNFIEKRENINEMMKELID